MSEYRKPNPRELEERIIFLQLTLATLKAQLDSQNSSDIDPVEDNHTATQLLAAQQPSFMETPLAIAAG